MTRVIDCAGLNTGDEAENYVPKEITRWDRITGKIYWKRMQNALELEDNEIILKRSRMAMQGTSAHDMAGVKKENGEMFLVYGIGYHSYGYTKGGEFDKYTPHVNKEKIEEIPSTEEIIKTMDKEADARDIGL